MSKDLFIYHPGTGTVISLRDTVFICDRELISDDDYETMENGGYVSEWEHKGYILDRYNMTNLFFGSGL